MLSHTQANKKFRDEHLSSNNVLKIQKAASCLLSNFCAPTFSKCFLSFLDHAVPSSWATTYGTSGPILRAFFLRGIPALLPDLPPTLSCSLHALGDSARYESRQGPRRTSAGRTWGLSKSLLLCTLICFHTQEEGNRWEKKRERRKGVMEKCRKFEMIGRKKPGHQGKEGLGALRSAGGGPGGSHLPDLSSIARYSPVASAGALDHSPSFCAIPS